jgi:hypothetical protein
MERTHGEGSGHDESCFGCKLLTTQFGPPKSAEHGRVKGWEKDMAAYHAMRGQNLQPVQIDGCAELQARAEDRWEVDHHMVMTKELRTSHLPMIKDAETMLKEEPVSAETVREWKDQAQAS